MDLSFSRIALIAVGLAATGAASAALAHKGAKGIVGERMMMMKHMGDGMKNLSHMVTGKAPFKANRVESIATMLKTHAEKIPSQFPKGSLQKPTEALPVIWEKWDEFKTQAEALAKLAIELEGSATTGQAASLAVFAKIGKSCSACHEVFRLKKEK
ncbi:MAG: c-type cytochrome [Hyphomicrobiaceae bacterium]